MYNEENFDNANYDYPLKVGYPVYKLIRAVNRQYPNNGFIDYVDVTEDIYSGQDYIIDEDLRDLINEAIQEVYIDIAKDEVFSFPTVPGQREYSLPEDCDLRDIQEVTRTFGNERMPFPPPPIPDGEMCIVSFDGNGGTGSMPNMNVQAGTTIVLPECQFVDPDGRPFLSWEDERETLHPAGESYVIYSSMTFKAIWSEVPVDPGRDVTFSINPLEGTFEDDEVSVTYEIPQGTALDHCPLVIPNEGYTFTDTWSIGEEVYTTEEIESYIVTDNILVEPILEYNPLGGEGGATPVVTPDPETPGDGGDGGEGDNPLADPTDPGRDPEDDDPLDDNPLDNGGDNNGGDNPLDDNPLG